jgi:hypothetical protein
LLSAFFVLNSVFERIGLDEEEAKKSLLTNLLGTSDKAYRPGTSSNEMEDNGTSNESSVSVASVFIIPRAKLLSSLATGDKTAAAAEMCQWVKQYVSSPEFAQAYAKQREALKPPPGNDVVKPDAETIQSTRESVKSLEKDLVAMRKEPGMPAATLQVMEKTLTDMKRSLEAWEDPNYRITQWERQYPADVKQLVKRRLQEYLAITATVDFGAALRTASGSGTRYFVKSEYEAKPRQWKAIFRAGPEVNATVTKFVKDWLQQDFGGTKAPTAKAPVTAPTPASNTKTEKQLIKPAKGRNPRTG